MLHAESIEEERAQALWHEHHLHVDHMTDFGTKPQEYVTIVYMGADTLTYALSWGNFLAVESSLSSNHNTPRVGLW